MNVAEILLRVKKTFGDEAGIEIDDPLIINWINDGMVDIARRTGCLQGEAQISSVLGQKTYDLPADYLSTKRVTFDGRKLEPIAVEDLDELDSDRDTVNQQGEPSNYYIWARKFNFYPIPNAEGVSNIVAMYTRMPNLVAISTDVPQIPIAFHEDIVRFVLARAKELDEETTDAQVIWRDYQDRVDFSKSEDQVKDISSYPAVRLVAGDE